MSGQISTQDITPFEATVGEAEMTDAPEKIWAVAEGLIAGHWRTPGDGDPLMETPYTRTDLAEAAERAAYLRGLEDAGAVIRNACNCDSALDAIRALAKEGGE